MHANPPTSNPYQAPSANPAAGIVQTSNDIVVGEIKSQAITSLVVSIISFFCLGIILAPFAIYRGSKAQRLIATTGLGVQYRGMAQAGLILGIIAFVLHAIGTLWLVLRSNAAV